MTTTPVMSITDEQIAEIEAATMLQAFRCCENPNIGGEYMGQCELVCCGNPESTEADISIAADDVLALISRLRAAEKDVERLEFMMANQAIIWSMNGLDMPAVYSVSWNGMGKDRHDKWFDTERAAIDAAMEQSK